MGESDGEVGARVERGMAIGQLGGHTWVGDRPTGVGHTFPEQAKIWPVAVLSAGLLKLGECWCDPVSNLMYVLGICHIFLTLTRAVDADMLALPVDSSEHNHRAVGSPIAMVRDNGVGDDAIQCPH